MLVSADMQICEIMNTLLPSGSVYAGRGGDWLVGP